MNTPMRSFVEIRQAFTLARQEQGMRHREIATMLGIGEGQLIAAHAGPNAVSPGCTLTAIRLRSEWPALIASLSSLGSVMALTRNHGCVHEKEGVYAPVSSSGEVGLVQGTDIDLRLFYAQWAAGFAVEEQTSKGKQLSLQFFDAQGQAVHKVFLREQSNITAWTQLLEQFASDDQTPGMVVRARTARSRPNDDAAVDISQLRAAWAALRDTHDFHDMLRDQGVARLQGLRLVGQDFAQPVDICSVHEVLTCAAQAGLPIMVFTMNHGAIQIHSGMVRRIVVTGPWINILDAGFNLHLREDAIASAWIVRKPTVDGMVSSLELFDSEGELLAMLFGVRKPGRPEQCEWRALLDALQPEVTPCAA
ncbi:hemin-degrading factor [Burkholderiaceae bacterium DAT-1]|nr:hemin-degrading factor [Burkholderiaceae bacterium DAT-1]